MKNRTSRISLEKGNFRIWWFVIPTAWWAAQNIINPDNPWRMSLIRNLLKRPSSSCDLSISIRNEGEINREKVKVQKVSGKVIEWKISIIEPKVKRKEKKGNGENNARKWKNHRWILNHSVTCCPTRIKITKYRQIPIINRLSLS